MFKSIYSRAATGLLTLAAVAALAGCGSGGNSNETFFTESSIVSFTSVVYTGNFNGTVTRAGEVNAQTASLVDPLNIAAVPSGTPTQANDVSAVVVSPDNSTLFVADFSQPAETGTITPFQISAFDGSLNPNFDNSFANFSGAPQVVAAEPTGQFLYVGQEDGTVQVLSVAAGAPITTVADNPTLSSFGQVNINGEAKALQVLTVGGSTLLIVANDAISQNLQSFIIQSDGTLLPADNETLGPANTGVAALTAYFANGTTFVLAGGNQSNSGEVATQTFSVASSGVLTPGQAVSLPSTVGLRAAVVRNTAGLSTPQAAFLVSTADSSGNLFSIPIDGNGTPQTAQSLTVAVGGVATSMLGDPTGSLFFVTSSDGITGAVVDAQGGVTLSPALTTDVGGAVSSAFVQVRCSCVSGEVGLSRLRRGR